MVSFAFNDHVFYCSVDCRIMETSEDILQIAIDLIRRSQTYEPRINLVKPEISEKPDVGQTIISNTNNEPENTDPDGFVHVDASSYAVGTFKGSPEKDQVSRDPLDPVIRDPHDPYYCGSNPSVSGSSLVNTTGSSALLSIEYAEFAQKYPYLFRMCTNVPSPESADNLIKILPMMLRQRDRVIVAEGKGDGDNNNNSNNVLSDRLKSATEMVMQRLNDTYIAPLGIKPVKSSKKK